MPRKTKEQNELEKDKKETKKTTSTAKKTAKKKLSTGDILKAVDKINKASSKKK